MAQSCSWFLWIVPVLSQLHCGEDQFSWCWGMYPFFPCLWAHILWSSSLAPSTTQLTPLIIAAAPLWPQSPQAGFELRTQPPSY